MSHSQSKRTSRTIRRAVVEHRRVDIQGPGSRAYDLKLACGHITTIYPVNADVPATSRCVDCERAERER